MNDDEIPQLRRTEIDVGIGDALLKRLMSSVFGVDKYVLIISAPCVKHHTHDIVEIHSANYSHEEKAKLLIDAAAGCSLPPSGGSND